MADSSIVYTKEPDEVYAPTGGGVARGADMGDVLTLTEQMADALAQAFGRFGSKTWDPGSLAAGAGEETTVTVTGALAGDFALANFSNPLQGLHLTAQMLTDGTATVRLQNGTNAGPVNLGSGTLSVWSRAKP